MLTLMLMFIIDSQSNHECKDNVDAPNDAVAF